MNEQQFIELTNGWIDIEQSLTKYTSKCTDEEKVFMINKFCETRNNTNTLLVKYITQDIPLGLRVADNLGEIVDVLISAFWEFVEGENTVYYYTYDEDGEQQQQEIVTAQDLYNCFETSKQALWH